MNKRADGVSDSGGAAGHRNSASAAARDGFHRDAGSRGAAPGTAGHAAAVPGAGDRAGNGADTPGRPGARQHAYSWRGPAALLGAALIWGGLYSVVKVALVGFPPFVLIACEYLLAAAILWPVAGRALFRTPARVLLKGAGMSLLWLAGVCLMFVAMKTTSPSFSAFIVGQTVVITPLLIWVSGGGWPGGRFAGALVLVVGGMAALLLWGGGLTYSAATALVFLAAVIYSVHIMVLGRLTHQANALVLVLEQVTITALGSLVLSLVFERWPAFPRDFTRPAWVLILYGGIASSLLAFLLQTLGQRQTPTTHVGIYIGLESVFGLVIAVAVGLDTLTWRMGLGFALVFAGTMLAQFGRRGRRRPDPLQEEPELDLTPPL